MRFYALCKGFHALSVMGICTSHHPFLYGGFFSSDRLQGMLSPLDEFIGPVSRRYFTLTCMY